jgi:Ser/Thr protein kinase RdoA (MazF antagonist)
MVEVVETPSPDIPGRSCFSIVSFDKAPGGHPRNEDWTPSLFHQMGCFMGRLHTLSRNYQPSKPEYRRHEWYEDEEDYAVLYLPPSESRIIEKFSQLIAYLKNLPRTPQSYGLIQMDFHSGNFFLEHRDHDEMSITLFDFDDCAYAPFVYDIAMALFYAVPHHCDSPADLKIARSFYHHFMDGYRQEYQLDPVWLKEIPNFLKLREMDLYTIIHRSFDLGHLGHWEASFMEGRKERLENDVPYINMEF